MMYAGNAQNINKFVVYIFTIKYKELILNHGSVVFW